MPNERPTPETDSSTFYMSDDNFSPVTNQAFARRLERERDEAREKLDAVSRRAERIRCELVAKEKQLDAMRSAVRSAYSVLDALATFHRHSPLWATLEATDTLNKLKPFTQR